MLTFQTTSKLTSPVYTDALMIRKYVFMEEQHVPSTIEIDGKDSLCLHIVGYDSQGRPVATARLYPLFEQAVKIQRVAVLKDARGKSYGKLLMLEIDRIAKEHMIQSLHLGAQNDAIPFYEKLGFHIVGDEYEEAGILHHDMERRL